MCFSNICMKYDVSTIKMQRYSIIRLEGKCQMDDPNSMKSKQYKKLCYSNTMMKRDKQRGFTMIKLVLLPSWVF